MLVTLAKQNYDFRPWTPDSPAFADGFAFDCETTLIDQERPWITPAFVLAAAFDSHHGYFITCDRLAAFFDAHRNRLVAMHNAAFDLAVINGVAPQLDIYGWVEGNLVYDTQIGHRLYTLATHGHTASGDGESTLERCGQLYGGIELPKDVLDSSGNVVRLSYGKWLGRRPVEIEPVYLEYLAKDVIATFTVCVQLRRRTRQLLENSSDVWGFVSPAWLAQQQTKFGLLTHNIQLKGSIALGQITANGLHLDADRREELVANLQEVLKWQRKDLARYGYLPGNKGSNKALQSIFCHMQREQPALYFPKTETGQFCTSYDALFELANTLPFVKLLLEHRETEKLLNSFLGKMARPVLHPSFNVLARTGRTTSFGEINAQNLPRDDGVRACFVPSPGHVFIDADYSIVELRTLSQSCVGQFGLESQMAAALNARKDPHTIVAAAVTGKAESAVTKAERQQAKPINFGKPGGMSNATLQRYAKATYGVELSHEQVQALSDAWFDLFPEMEAFLENGGNVCLDVAKLLDLTLASHFAYTGSERFLTHRHCQCRPDDPNPVLGGMCLKALKQANPTTAAGRPYGDADIEYFFTQLAAKIELLPQRFHRAARERTPSPQLQRAVLGLAGRASVFTLTGRLRANASYCARHNTVFQGLAADGAKLAMWALWRAGYRIVNFIHDEFLIEVPAGSDLKSHAERIRQIMIDGMRRVVPDVLIDVKYAAADRWHKDAEPVFDATGEKLMLWQPPSITRPVPTAIVKNSRDRKRPSREAASSASNQLGGSHHLHERSHHESQQHHQQQRIERVG
jgi:DNA polymerase I-like protein with 3'-5' exonuclease and polymerase domains